MNFNTLTFFINTLIFLFLMIGLLWGIRRGAFKSLLRFVFLIFNCLFWLLVTPVFSKALLNANISGLFNLSLNGISFSTLKGFFSYYLNNNATVLELIAENPVIASFIGEVPMVIVNFIIFIMGYFLLKSLTFPIYSWLANTIIKKREQKKTFAPKSFKNKFFGAILGLLQGGLTGMVLFLPLSSVALLLDNNEQTQLSISYANLAVDEQIINDYSVEFENPPLLENPPIKDNYTNSEIEEFLNIYYNTVLSNALKVMNLNKLNEFIFVELSSVKINGVKISLGAEVKTASNILIKARDILASKNVLSLDNVS